MKQRKVTLMKSYRPGVGKYFLRRATLKILLLSGPHASITYITHIIALKT